MKIDKNAFWYIKQLLIFLLIFCLFDSVSADDALLTRKDTNGDFTDYQSFIVDMKNPPVYASAAGTSPKAVFFEMGELFFGIKEETVGGTTRVLVGKYGLDKKFQEIGWIDSVHLLRNREPMTVGEAVELGTLDSNTISKSASAFSRTNALDLRVVTKPESKMELAPYPGGSGKTGNPGFTWYYVFDSEIVSGKTYYLIGSSQRLSDSPLLTNTNEESAKARLLGWVEKEKVKEWCSNIVLEYNTDEVAVVDRYKEGQNRQPGKTASPALVYAGVEPNSAVIAREPLLDFWGHLFGIQTPDERKLAFFSDKGLLPDVPRFHVVEKVEIKDGKEMYRVATLGSLNQQLSASDIALKTQQISEVSKALGKVDLVFVIDCTGSMQDEIETVGAWLKELAAVFEKRSKQGSGSAPIQFRGKMIELSGNLDIRFSLVGYQDIGGPKLASGASSVNGGFGTRVFVQGISLEGKSEEIGRAVDNMIGSLGGGTEALHDGLYETLTNQELWRRDSALRLVIVVADEKGDIGGKTQADVLKAMIPPQWAGEVIDGKSSKKLFTPIYGIYTSANEFTEFQNNLSQLVQIEEDEDESGANRFFHLPEFKDNESERKKMIDILYGPIEKVQKRMNARATRFAEKLYGDGKEQENLQASTATVILDELAIKLAMESAGVKSIGELKVMTSVAFTEGWVRLQQDNHSNATYRMCATLLRPEIDEIQGAMDKIAGALEKVITQKEWLKRNPKELIAEALVTALAEVSNRDDLVADQAALNEKAKELLEKLLSEPEVSLQTLLGLKESLPISETGLLGRPASEILNFKLIDFSNQIRNLRQKAKCLRNIVNGETAPLDISKIDAYKTDFKKWIYRHPLSGDEFIFVPIEYLP